jgi:hypothetical protein
VEEGERAHARHLTGGGARRMALPMYSTAPLTGCLPSAEREHIEAPDSAAFLNYLNMLYQSSD